MFAEAEEVIGTNYRIEPIAEAGSRRKYSRVITDNSSYILCESADIEENISFMYLSKLFSEHQIPVPKVLAVSPDKSAYLLSDMGKHSLLDIVLQEGHTKRVYELYSQCIIDLVTIQLIAGASVDFNKLLVKTPFDAVSVWADLNYFKYYFLDVHISDYDKRALHVEFDALSKRCNKWHTLGFMYRDLQGRNIMVHEDKIGFIDYQGGMEGPIQYDVASLLWQAKAALPDSWRKELYTLYKNEVKKHVSIKDELFDAEYQLIILVRLLQVLGAYGLRGLIEKKPHFISSIPQGLFNVRTWLNQYDLSTYPTLKELLQKLTQDNFIKKYS